MIEMTRTMMRRNQNYGKRAEEMIWGWNVAGYSLDDMRKATAKLHNGEDIQTPLRNRLMSLIYDIETA